jgi:hypothetical protein
MSSFNPNVNFSEYAEISNKYFENFNQTVKANNKKGYMGAMSSDGNFLMIREKKGGFFGIGAKKIRTLIDISNLNNEKKTKIATRLSQGVTAQAFQNSKLKLLKKCKSLTVEYGSFSFSKTKQAAKKKLQEAIELIQIHEAQNFGLPEANGGLMPEGSFHSLTPELRQKYINNPFMPKSSALQNIINSCSLKPEEKKKMILEFKDHFKNSFQKDFMVREGMVTETPNATKGGIIEDLSGLILDTDDETANKLIGENKLKEENKGEWKRERLEAIGTIVSTIVPSMSPAEQTGLLQNLYEARKYAFEDEANFEKTAIQKADAKAKREAYDFLIGNVFQSMDPEDRGIVLH